MKKAKKLLVVLMAVIMVIGLVPPIMASASGNMLELSVVGPFDENHAPITTALNSQQEFIVDVRINRLPAAAGVGWNVGFFYMHYDSAVVEFVGVIPNPDTPSQVNFGTFVAGHIPSRATILSMPIQHFLVHTDVAISLQFRVLANIPAGAAATPISISVNHPYHGFAGNDGVNFGIDMLTQIGGRPLNIALVAPPVVGGVQNHSITFNLNGGTQAADESPALLSQTVRRGSDGVMIADPTQPGNTFDGWAVSPAGATVANVQENITFIAQWAPIFGETPDDDNDENGENNENGEGNGEIEGQETTPADSNNNNDSEGSANQDNEQDELEEYPPLDEHEDIDGERNAPLGPGPINTILAALGIEERGSGTWALSSLILAVLGAALGLAITICAVVKRKHENLEEKGKRNRMICLVATIVLAILGAIVFIIFNDMHNPMVFINIWTIVNAVLFLAGAISVVLQYKIFRD